MATAAKGGIDLQREELEAVKEQLNLQEQEVQAMGGQLQLARADFEARRAASEPVLEVSTGYRVSGTPRQVKVGYIQGNEPAVDVRVWVRSPSGYMNFDIGTLTRENTPWFASIGADETWQKVVSDWPFETATAPLARGKYEIWAGVTWSTIAGASHRHLRRYWSEDFLRDLRDDAAV